MKNAPNITDYYGSLQDASRAANRLMDALGWAENLTTRDLTEALMILANITRQIATLTANKADQ